VSWALASQADVWLLGQHVLRNALAGAFGALGASLLAAFTEPVLNRVAAQRVTLAEAVAEVRLADVACFFRTVLATNLLKFPFFEAVYTVTSSLTAVPPVLRGMAAAAIYTTAMLPFSNYRYLRSLQRRVGVDMLYQAYAPTLLRDLAYGVARMQALTALAAASPALAATARGQSLLSFLAISCGMLASAPGNELRAYCLQPRHRRLPPREFFRLGPFLRSALLGALIPSTAIVLGQLLVSEATSLLGCLRLGPGLPPALSLWPVAAAVLVFKLNHARRCRRRARCRGDRPGVPPQLQQVPLLPAPQLLEPSAGGAMGEDLEVSTAR